jgi:hypothetical protein
MKTAIAIAALATVALVSSGTRADVSLAVTADAPFAPCGSGQRAELKRALASYCEHDATADERACHLARRALRCEKPGPTKACAESGDAWLLDEGERRVQLNLNEGCGGSWHIEFEPRGRGYVVGSVSYDFGSCSGP